VDDDDDDDARLHGEMILTTIAATIAATVPLTGCCNVVITNIMIEY